MSQHIGKAACVRIKDASLVVCRECSTIVYDASALKKHQGNKICLSKGLMLKASADGGVAVFARATAHVASNTARVVALRQAIRLKAIAEPCPIVT
jgi:ribosome-binding protein aMBF1 (putative translation factor)